MSVKHSRWINKHYPLETFPYSSYNSFPLQNHQQQMSPFHTKDMDEQLVIKLLIFKKTFMLHITMLTELV